MRRPLPPDVQRGARALGAELCRAREAAGLSVESVALAVGMHESTLRGTEEGRKRTRTSVLARYAVAIAPRAPQPLLDRLIALGGPAIAPEAASTAGGGSTPEARRYVAASKAALRTLSDPEATEADLAHAYEVLTLGMRNPDPFRKACEHFRGARRNVSDDDPGLASPAQATTPEAPSVRPFPHDLGAASSGHDGSSRNHERNA